MRWTFTNSIESSLREYTVTKTLEQKEKICHLFNVLIQQLPAYVRGDHDEKEQSFTCQYIAIKENKACLFRIKQLYHSGKNISSYEMHALFSGQQEFSLGGTEVAAKALFSLLKRKFQSHDDSTTSNCNKNDEHMADFVVYN